MVVGICELKLRLPGNHSLKGKRQVVRSIVDRVKSRFNVSIAEVDEQDTWQRATLGISCVANENRFAQEILSKVISLVEENHKAEIIDYNIEII